MDNSIFECSLEQLVYCPNSDANLKELEYTNKVILNSTVLEKISKKIDKFDSPMIFKVTNTTVFGIYEVFVGVHEFSASGNKMYMPNHLMEKIFGQQGSLVSISYYVPPKGSFIKLRPKAENFYKIMDIKKFLENNIQKNYPVLQLENSILIKHENQEIELVITDLKPFDVVSTVDTDIEVDFEEIETIKKDTLINNFINSNNELDLNSLLPESKETFNDKIEYIPNLKHFEEIISNNDKVFIQFTAKWCGPCKEFAPKFDRISKRFNKQAKFFRIDVDQNTNVSDKYDIHSVPNVLYFYNGNKIDSITNTTEENLVHFVKKNISNNNLPINQYNKEKIKPYSKTDGFVPFSGKGYTLGSE